MKTGIPKMKTASVTHFRLMICLYVSFEPIFILRITPASRGEEFVPLAGFVSLLILGV